MSSTKEWVGGCEKSMELNWACGYGATKFRTLLHSPEKIGMNIALLYGMPSTTRVPLKVKSSIQRRRDSITKNGKRDGSRNNMIGFMIKSKQRVQDLQGWRSKLWACQMQKGFELTF